MSVHECSVMRYGSAAPIVALAGQTGGWPDRGICRAGSGTESLKIYNGMATDSKKDVMRTIQTASLIGRANNELSIAIMTSCARYKIGARSFALLPRSATSCYF